MQTISWRVELSAPPAAMRHCRRCGAERDFISSGRFRVNAQRKLLDIWLIYQCGRCDATWNATLYSRVRPGSFAPDLLERFHYNDPTLALEYACRCDLLRKNGAVPGTPHYHIEGEPVPPGTPSVVTIAAMYPCELRMGVIVREKLGLPRAAFTRLVRQGDIRIVDGRELDRCRLTGEDSIVIRLPKRSVE